MLATLRSNWLSIKASYWFYPALFALAGLALALTLIRLDHLGGADWLAHSGWVTPTRPDGASNILTVLSGSMIGVASTVFSITIAAVAYASGTYGPRLLTNFMEDKGNQLSLATFIGTFTYSITVLRSVRAADETAPSIRQALDTPAPGFVPQLSLLVAFGMMIVAVGVLVYFLHHIPASIRINSVLDTIGSRLLREIDARFPHEGGIDPPRRALPHGAAVHARDTGYIRLVEYGALRNEAARHGLLLGLALRPGDFVYCGVPLVTTDADTIPDEVADAIAGAFAIGSSRTPEQDLEFSIDELVEIALRALSPGINDPFTAITAIHWLGAATAAFGRRDLGTEPWSGGDPDCPVIPAQSDFAHFLERGFAAARTGVASNRLAALVALESLATAAQQVIGAHRRNLLVGEMDRLVEHARALLPAPALEDIALRHRALRAILGEPPPEAG